MTAPITPDERAALRERYTADLPIAWNMPAAAHARALRDLGRTAREVVPRLLDALAIAEAERNGARGRVRTTKDELRRMDNFLRLEREAACENLARAEKAEAELAQLRKETACPAPVRDEDAVTEAVARKLHADACSEYDYAWEPNASTFRDQARELLAVVREHLPVRPDRETVARFIDPDAWLTTAEFEAEYGSFPDWSSDSRPSRQKAALTRADAVLALWPGEPRATVQAEALAAWKAANATVVEAVALLGGTFGESLREALAVDPKGADRG